MSPFPPLSNRTVAVIGGDRRMLHAASRFAEAGASVNVLGHSRSLPAEPQIHAFHTLTDAARDADILLLPLPSTRDGRTVNTPFAPELSISFDELVSLMRAHPDRLLFGGCLPLGLSDAVSALADARPRVIDYDTDEALLLRNAYLTAEGALMLAMQESDRSLRGATAAILGYGRIGKLLARLLLSIGMEVTVCARRRESLQWAATDGCHPMKMGDATRAGGGLFPLCCGHPIIFNTVPEQILERELLLRLEPDTLLIDLASPPFGAREADASEATQKNGLRYLRAPGLPGRYAPRDAGHAIADSVLEVLRRYAFPLKGDAST